MSATLLDGAALARRWTEAAAARVAALAARGIRPALAVVIVGDNAASQLYVRNKERMCAAAGVASRRLAFPADAPSASVLRALAQLNADPNVHGILVQLPLPAHLDAARIVEAIAPEKDVDGFRPDNLGALFMDAAALAPCTPQAVLALLEAHGIPVEGRHAVVVGRSNIVGKPLSLMLLARGATVTTCHSRTPDLAAHTRRADILVAAVGRAHLVRGEMVKPGAAVIDVGINRRDDGRIVGDVDFADVAPIAGHLTPVPGGVGPMTVACLVANAIATAERQHAGRPRILATP